MAIKPIDQDQEDIRIQVRQRYGKIAADTPAGQVASCCGPADSSSACCGPEADVSLDQVAVLYDQAPDASELPDEVTSLSLGCGDPVTLASLQPGQTVLDLGAGGGIDCFLAAKRVGESGRVIGVDMTPEMLQKARANKARLGATNVEFRLGEIEHLPVSDQSVDVSAWAECIGGALDVADYVAAIEAAGFVDIQVDRVYMDPALIDEAASQLDLDPILIGQSSEVQKKIFSAKVTASKAA